jgi:D-tyrosyl-tRNA(Tyr) deacylase
MNKSVLDCNGGILLISNFTLYGDVNKGFRPSFIKAAPPEIAEPLYQSMIDYIRNIYPIKIATGVFGAKMDIELVNDGPVTIFIEK